MPVDTDVTIGPAPRDSTTEVLSLVFGNCQPQDALNRVRAALEEHRAGALPRDGLLAASRDQQLVGAVFSQVLPGRAATFWPPQLVLGEPEQTAQALAAKAIEYARNAGVAVIHAVLEGIPNPQDVQRLEQAGFSPLAELYYLAAEACEFPTSEPAGPLDFEPCTSQDFSRICRVVEATYEATLDCPSLNGIRSAVDVLAGYGGRHDNCPPHWFLARHEGRDVGCLLLGDYPEQDNCELTYMGLVPAARSHGWGLLVTRHAQWIARSIGRSRVVLAVDSLNQPARNMYAAAGFRGWDRRQVYMLVPKANSASPQTVS